MVIKLHPVYPDYIFRGAADCKNVAPKEDMWSEGTLYRDDHGMLLIANRKAGDGVYSQDYIVPETLGLSSGFSDFRGKEIFEGDIVKIRRFTETKSLGGFPTADTLLASMGMNEAENEETAVKGDNDRVIHSRIPTGFEAKEKYKGVVFLQCGLFYIQYFDKKLEALNCMPLHEFFYYDALPAPDVVFEIIGNIYDDVELYEEVLHIPHMPVPEQL